VPRKPNTATRTAKRTGNRRSKVGLSARHQHDPETLLAECLGEIPNHANPFRALIHQAETITNCEIVALNVRPAPAVPREANMRRLRELSDRAFDAGRAAGIDPLSLDQPLDALYEACDAITRYGIYTASGPVPENHEKLFIGEQHPQLATLIQSQKQPLRQILALEQAVVRAKPRGGQGKPRLPPVPVDDEDRAILTVLNKAHPNLLTCKAIETAINSNISEKTIQVRLNALIQNRLASRPKGKKRGAMITERGQEVLVQAAKASRISS
jgi:hypothetical protein